MNTEVPGLNSIMETSTDIRKYCGDVFDPYIRKWERKKICLLATVNLFDL
jgi:hypothetical protein